MKKLMLIVAALMIVMTASVARPKASRIFTGEIMDSSCAQLGSHAKMMKSMDIKTARECTLDCVKAGAKFVLHDATRKVTYELDDQEKARDFAGQKVKVTGTYDTATKTIHVEKIEASS